MRSFEVSANAASPRLRMSNDAASLLHRARRAGPGLVDRASSFEADLVIFLVVASARPALLERRLQVVVLGWICARFARRDRDDSRPSRRGA